VEDPQFTKDYHDPDKRSIANALTVEFTDGKKLKEIVCEYPIGHKRRRKDGIPLLEAKFRVNLARRFPARQQQAILDVSLDQKKLEAISKALSKVPGCEDFILHQERQVNTVVNEASLTKVFEAGLFESHGSLVSVLSVKPTVKTPEVSSAIARAQKLLGVEVKR
jgi:hypothetical protein